jgi:hypothetical protein
MKLAVAIFLFAFTLLTAGCGCAMAGPHGDVVCPAASVNSDRAKLNGAQQLLLSHDGDQDQDDTVLARVDDDDDETINRKYLPITGYFLAFTWALISTDRNALQTDHFSIWRDVSRPGSRIYIAQRVLRI